MRLSRRISRRALVGLCATFLLVACSGSDGGGDIQKGAQPQLKVDPSETLAFNEIDVNDSVSKTIEISNQGGAPLEINNIKLKEGDEDERREFTAGKDWRESATIGPDQDPITLTVTYSPVNPVTDTGEITFDTNDEEQPKKTVKLQPRDLAPRVKVQDTVNFGSVRPGETRRQPFVIRNTGEAVLRIDRLQLSGSSLFQVTVPKEDGGSGGGGGGGKKKNDKDMDKQDELKPKDDKPVEQVLPKELQPNEAFELRGWFMPEDNDPEKAELTIFSNAPSGKTTVKLIGNSKAPCLDLSHKNELGFGAASTGKISRKRVTLENCRPRSEKPLKIEEIKITDDGGGVFGLTKDTLPGDLDKGKTYKLPGDKRANFEVTFTPPKNKSYDGKLLVKSNDPSLEDHTIKLTGEGTDNECPEAEAKAKVKDGGGVPKSTLNTLPLETIVFDGTGSKDPDGSVKRYEWSIISRPADSNARLTPNSNVKKPKLFLDLAGTYEVELVVFDNKGATSCGKQAIVEIKAIPQEDIHVQLVWDTPNDQDPADSSGTDLDLHYLNPNAASWNEAPWDIYWNNKTADWGQENIQKDDPSLDIDDTDGRGPENVNHNNPKSGKSYRVGVYYYDDHGFGPSYATIRIYTNGTLAQEYKNKFMSGTFDFWKVALIEWPTGNIYPRDEKFTGFPNAP